MSIKLSLLFFFLSSQIIANNIALMDLEELMNVKIYSATKSYETISNIPSNVIVVTKKDIQRLGYSSLIDVLKHQAGIFIIDTTTGYEISSKGSTGSTFKYMLNSVPIMDTRSPKLAYTLRFYFDIPIDAIERIEIVKSTQAVTYGTNAMYGSINVVTNSFKDKSRVVVAAGSNQNMKLFASTNINTQYGDMSINAGYSQNGGISGDLSKTMSADDYNSMKAGSNKSLDGLLDSNHKYLDFTYKYETLKLQAIISDYNYGYYRALGRYWEYSLYRDGIEKNSLYKQVSLEYEPKITDSLTNKTVVIYSELVSDVYERPLYAPDVTGQSNYTDIQRYELDSHFNYKIDEHNSLLIGFRLAQFTADAKLQLYGVYTGEFYDYFGHYDFSNREEKDIYIKYKYYLKDSLSFNIGYRHSIIDESSYQFSYEKDYIDPAAVNSDAAGVQSPRIMESKKFHLPELSLIYEIDKRNQLKMLFGKAYQLQMGGTDEYEKMYSYDINYLYQSKNFYNSLSLYYTKTENLGLFSSDRQTSDGRNISIGSGEVYGIENELRYKYSEKFTNSLDIIYQWEQENTDAAQVDTGAPLFANWIVKYDSSVKIDNLIISMIVNYIGSMKSSFKRGSFERYGEDSPENITIDINMNYKINEHSMVKLSVKNLLNRDNRVPATGYFTHFEKGMFTPQREAIIEYSYKF